jgi:probable HAF family extracellular repeat protein
MVTEPSSALSITIRNLRYLNQINNLSGERGGNRTHDPLIYNQKLLLRGPYYAKGNSCCDYHSGIGFFSLVAPSFGYTSPFLGYSGPFAFIYSDGTYTDLPINPLAPDDAFYSGINNSGQIVGQYGTGSATNGFILENGTYTSLTYPGSIFTAASGINNAGQIVGTHQVNSTSDQGFIYSDGVYTTISDPDDPNNTFASGINDLGQIVGVINQLGFLYTNGTYTTIDGTAYGINDSGQIVGISGSPEPSTWAMMLVGFAGLGCAGWRSRRAFV